MVSFLQSLPDLISSGKDLAEGGIWAAIGVFATAAFKWLTSKERNEKKSTEVFTKNLLDRCASLEKDNDRLRNENETKEELHDREISVRRHEAANAKTCFNYLMMLVKRIPNPPPELLSIISEIELMRSDLLKREDQERHSWEEFEKAIRRIHQDRP